MDPKDYVGRKVTIKDSGTVRQYDVCALTKEGMGFLSLEGVTFGVFTLDRLELVPMDPHYNSGAYRAGFKQAGTINIHADEAVEFLAFVMLQASSLFQSVPSPAPCPTCKGGTIRGNVNDGGDCSDCMNTRYDDGDAYRRELERLLTVRGEPVDGPCVKAALAYYDAALTWYEADKAKWDD